MPVIIRSKEGDREVHTFMGIPLKVKAKDKIRYLGGVLTVKIRNGRKSFYLFGAKIFSKSTGQEERLAMLERKLDECLAQSYNLATVVQAQHINRQTFGPFRGAFRGKKVVIAGCGPTLSQYSPIEGALHIGVNRAYKHDKVKFDYLFVQDPLAEGMDEFNAYRAGDCQKFYGVIPPNRIRQCFPTLNRIPVSECIRAGGFPYILQDVPDRDVAYDISCEPVGDFSGTVFSVLHFLMYSLPDEIYLVGFDCSSGHFYGNDGCRLDYQKKNWLLFSNILKSKYPQIKVYSVNPVGLKGIFYDLELDSTDN